MKRPALLVIPLLAGLPLPALADCQSIVERTVAELRAGYPDWDDRLETLARTAAGSACVKAAQPGNRAAATNAAAPAAATPGNKATMTSTAVAAASAESAADSGAEDGASDESAEKGEEGEEGWTPFKDIKFNNVSARPGKKPYERRREVNETD